MSGMLRSNNLTSTPHWRRNHAFPLADICQKRIADVPNGAHMEIGTYGDLATMHWVQNEPWAPGVLDCSVTHGALPCPAPDILNSEIWSCLSQAAHSGPRRLCS